MNQMGFVEISLVKNDLLYRASLPMGVPWSDAREALLELADQITAHIKEVEDKQAADAASKLEEQPVELVN